MKYASFDPKEGFDPDKVKTQLILETPFSKEIQILMKEGQLMKSHKAPFPIIVHLLRGSIDFGLENETQRLATGDILSLDANIPHDLKALEDSVVRLSLSKEDKANRVKAVAKDS